MHFVAIVGNKEGLVHILQIAEERVERVADYLSVGQEVMVKVEIDRQGRIRLTMRDVISLHLIMRVQLKKNNN